MGCVYSAKFPNGKLYIGMTTIGFHKRKSEHKCCYKNENCQVFVYLAMRKYGWENIEWNVLFESVEENELEHVECWYIKEFNTQDRNFGYNLKEGGSHGKHSKETKEKISKSQKEYWKTHTHPTLGRKHTEEAKKQISEALKGKYVGEFSSFYGKTHTEETKKKLSESNKGRKRSEDTIKKMSEAQMGKVCSTETKKKLREAMRGKNAGEKSGNAKLNWEKVREIRKMYEFCDMTQEKLAKFFEVTQGCISRILLNKSWIEQESGN